MTNICLDQNLRCHQHQQFSSDLSSYISTNYRLTSDSSPIALLKTSDYDHIRSIVDTYYPDLLHSSIPQLSDLLPSSFFLKTGWDFLKCRIDPELCNSCITTLSTSNSLSAAIVENPLVKDLLSSFYTEVQVWFETQFPAQHYMFPWRLHYYYLENLSDSLSTSWHYDMEVSHSNFFAMLYLNTVPEFGTQVYKYSSSRNISDNGGYYGCPIGYRSTDLSHFSHIPDYTAPSSFQSVSGDILIFAPSMCLHRGFTPSRVKPNHGRHNLHLSSMIIPSENQESFLGYSDYVKNFLLKPVDHKYSGVPPFLTP